MVVGVNLLFIQPDRNLGTFTYVKNVLNAMAEHEGVRLILFTHDVNHQLVEESIPGETVRCPVDGSNLIRRGLYEQTRLTALARRHGCEVLWCPGYLAPIRSSLPVVVTIHDMQYRDIPESVSRLKRGVYHAIVPRAARRARRVIAVSNFSRERILHYTGAAPENVVVTYEASFADPAGRSPDATAYEKLSELDIPEKYLLSVSSGLPHKNIPRLVEGFAKSTQRQSQGVKLVFVGSPPSPEAAKAAELAPGAVQFLGYLPEDVLTEAYRNAYGFVLASYYEGFGLPVLEAMQFGVPVACSRAASLPEVGGDAAVYFDPFCTDSIADAVDVLVGEQAQARAARIESGYRNLDRFSWEKCASETVNVLREAIRG